ncbi:MAG: nucleotide exchange factor GrpE [Candidatus Sulfotelmatobacter sp.]
MGKSWPTLAPDRTPNHRAWPKTHVQKLLQAKRRKNRRWHIPGIRSQLGKKQKPERDELLDRLARTQAEFENTRKRLNKEQDEFKELALADAIKSLLPILDGFDWAIQSPYQNVEEFRSGISLIRKQLQDSLSNLGLRAIPADGEPFDPRLHQAVEVVNTTVTQDNQVLKDVRRGYKLKDRLLRPAMVLVAHNPEGDANGDAQGEQSKRL